MHEQDLLEKLDCFDPEQRRDALGQLVRDSVVPQPGSNHNMHIHSFCSFNGWDHSPTHIVYRARKGGLTSAALCDFDVLDGMEEFILAGELIGLRTAVHLETRAYLSEFGDVDINSPGEAGVTYIMGAGYVREAAEGSPQASILAGFRNQARRRNEALIDRINPALADITIDYAKDVLPLTPSGNATERHIIRAYVDCAERRFDDTAARADFWANVLGRSSEELKPLLADRPGLEELARSRLVKRGGIGYEAPTSRTFPTVDEFVSWVRSCRAIPMVAWLDGTTGGESDPRKLLDCLIAKGAAAVNIVPERNWNLPDPEQSSLKRVKLMEFVRAAVELGLPINIGTEMNKRGLPFVDDLSGPVLSFHAEAFRTGARIMVGHSVLLRYADLSYVDDRAREEGGGTVAGKNALFESVGTLPAVTQDRAARLRDLGVERALSVIRDSALRGDWTL